MVKCPVCRSTKISKNNKGTNCRNCGYTNINQDEQTENDTIREQFTTADKTF